MEKVNPEQLENVDEEQFFNEILKFIREKKW
jgi:hypothetical protein